ncbi:MAG: hypothetical protein P4M11_07030 [Candidatus Pacebacteria bacterium]|nr:hypothetical protein [Candidatus Paceibacterota bacterium]
MNPYMCIVAATIYISLIPFVLAGYESFSRAVLALVFYVYSWMLVVYQGDLITGPTAIATSISESTKSISHVLLHPDSVPVRPAGPTLLVRLHLPGQHPHMWGVCDVLPAAGDHGASEGRDKGRHGH